jgi:protein SCO1/2/putative membrane protein
MFAGNSSSRLATLRRSVSVFTLLRSVAKRRIGTVVTRWSLILPILFCLSGAAPLDDDLGEVGDFALTERDGRTVRNADLRGHVWIASFVFTRCTAGCPQISTTMKRLQDDLSGFTDVRLVTFTVDPKNDDPKKLREYAEHFGADPRRWLFLTGEQDAIYHLLENTFHLPARQNEGEERQPGNEVAHSSKLVLVDRQGHIRGYYEGMPDPRLPDDADYQASIKKLEAKVNALVHDAWYLPGDFPRFNASLNALSAVLLLLGFTAIRRRLVRLHVICMLSALCVSALFLTAYLYYHLVIKHGQATSFADQTSHAHPPAWIGTVYLTVLLTHTVLAAIVAPMAVYTAFQGLRGRLEKHVRIARWTLPIWLYVSITGVVVYWMLYRLYPSP